MQLNWRGTLKTYLVFKKGNPMFFLFDVGGTKIRMVGADDNGFVGDPVIVATPKDFEEGIRLLVETCRVFCNGKKLTGIVGGLAGTLNRSRHRLVSGSNIGPWVVDKSIQGLLGEALDTWVHLENDAALAGLGEAVSGVGKDYEIVGYITVSTGVGGARITNKTIDRCVWGFEPGFQIVDFDKSLCSGCTKAYLGAHISGRGIEDHYGRKAEEIIDPAIWEDIAKYLGIGLTNTILHWSPDIIVLGGSVMQSISIERVRELVKEFLHVYPEIPLIERAQLGDIGGLYGALHIARTFK